MMANDLGNSPNKIRIYVKCVHMFTNVKTQKKELRTGKKRERMWWWCVLTGKFVIMKWNKTLKSSLCQVKVRQKKPKQQQQKTNNRDGHTINSWHSIWDLWHIHHSLSHKIQHRNHSQLFDSPIKSVCVSVVSLYPQKFAYSFHLITFHK